MIQPSHVYSPRRTLPYSASTVHSIIAGRGCPYVSPTNCPGKIRSASRGAPCVRTAVVAICRDGRSAIFVRVDDSKRKAVHSCKESKPLDAEFRRRSGRKFHIRCFSQTPRPAGTPALHPADHPAENIFFMVPRKTL